MRAARILTPLLALGTLCVGCGRVHYGVFAQDGSTGDGGETDGGVRDADAGSADAGPRDADAGPSNTFYISPDGDDANPGSRDAPWKTFEHALGQLAPGYTLSLLPGTYSWASGTGVPMVDCSAMGTSCGGTACVDGRADAPITLRAEQERQASITAGSGDRALWVRECSHWVFEGLTVEGADHPDAPSSTVEVDASTGIVMRRLLGRHANRYGRGGVIQIVDSADVLVEECEVYDFHQKGLFVVSSDRVTLRRNYTNPRGFPNIEGGADDTCPGSSGDSDWAGLYFWGSDSCIVENNIWEGGCMSTRLLPARNGGDGIVYAGNIALEPSFAGYYSNNFCDSADPCTDESLFIDDNQYIDNVSIGGTYGFYLRGGVGTTLTNETALGYSGHGYKVDLTGDNMGMPATVAIANSLAASSATYSFRILDQSEWSIRYSNAFGDETPYTPSTVDDTNGTFDPRLGGCFVYVPPESPAKGAGRAGMDIGANVVFRYEDGVVSSEPLWDPATGAFPCGATISGVNDPGTFPDASCATVHERLHVGTGGCPIP